MFEFPDHLNCCSICPNLTSSFFSEPATEDDDADRAPSVSVDFRSRVAFGVIFVTLTSLSSLGGAIILPLLHRRIYRYAMVWLVGVAVGTLAGSGLLHLLPVALKIQKIHDHEIHKVKPVFSSLCILRGECLALTTH